MTNNYEWRKNRNLHAICLLDMILNNRFEEPYNKFPTDGPLPLLSKPIIKSKLSKKFWLYSQYLESQNYINSEDDFSSSENNKNSIDNNYMNKNSIYNENKMNFKANYKRPKSSGIKLNNINRNKIINKKNKNTTNDMDEINKLNEIIYNLKYELNKQDFIINNQINEKMKLQKRISELEQIIKNFC